MKKKLVLAVCFILLLNITGCSSNKTGGINPSLYREDVNIVFLGALSLPLELDNKSIWVEKGPIVIVPNENNIAYRVIDKQELEFIGAIKKPYEFFKNAFNNPDDIEQLFIDGFGEITNKSHHVGNNVEIYIIEIKDNLKIYILSPSLDFVVEVSSKDKSGKLIETIISKTYLK